MVASSITDDRETTRCPYTRRHAVRLQRHRRHLQGVRLGRRDVPGVRGHPQWQVQQQFLQELHQQLARRVHGRHARPDEVHVRRRLSVLVGSNWLRAT